MPYMVSFSICLKLQYGIFYLIISYRQYYSVHSTYLYTTHATIVHTIQYTQYRLTQQLNILINIQQYKLLDFNVFHNIMHNPKVSHEWFKVGLAASIAIVFLKGYIELYKGKRQGKKVEYENFKTATHCTILLILLSWISFHLSLSPVYGTVKTWLIMIGFGWGVLIQCALFIPGKSALVLFYLCIYVI